MDGAEAEEGTVQVVGIARTDGLERDGAGIETIDLWYSERRRVWIVERIDADGNQVGAAHRCDSEEEAALCLAEWLRAHDETHLVAPRMATAAEKRVLAGRPRQRAA